MNFAATEAEDFDVVIVLDVEANGIEIGQGLTFLIFFPVIRIAAEKDIGAGVVIGDIEGAEDGHFFFGRVGGENGDLVEEAFESRYWGGESDSDCVCSRSLDADLAITGAERVAGGGVELRIHEGFHGEGNVFDEERVERFWFAVETEMELAAGLGGGLCSDESRTAHGDR